MWHRIRLNPSAAVDYRFPKNCRKSLRSLKYQHLHPFSQKGMLTRECESSRFEHIDVTANRPLSKLDHPGKLDHPEGNSGFQFRPSKQVPDFENDITISSRALCRDFRVQDNAPIFQERNLRDSPCGWPTPLLLDAFISPRTPETALFSGNDVFSQKKWKLGSSGLSVRILADILSRYLPILQVFPFIWAKLLFTVRQSNL